MKTERNWRLLLTACLFIGSAVAIALTVHVATQAHADMGGTIASNYFAPYVDIGADTNSKTLVQYAQASGDKYFTLTAIQAANGCTPEWGGADVTLNNDNNPQNGSGIIANTVKPQIDALHNAGDNVIISFGGSSADNAQGGDLAQACTSATSLEQAYQAVVDHYNVDHLDFDIEGKVSTDLAASTRRDQAINQLIQIEKSKGTNLVISFTVPVVKEGLVDDSNSPYPSNGLDVVKRAISDQVPVSVFNIMTMYYGSECNNCDMGSVAGQSADAFEQQLAGFYSQAGQTFTQSQVYSKIGITPIIDNPTGVVASENSLSISGAQELLTYAQSHHIGELSMWDFNRDIQHNFAYSNILSAFSSNQVQNPTTPSDPNQGATPTPTPDPNQGATPTPTPTPGLNQSNVQPWSSDNNSKLYNPGDLVSYNGHIWLCKQQIWGQAQWTPDAPGIEGQYWVQDDGASSYHGPISNPIVSGAPIIAGAPNPVTTSNPTVTPTVAASNPPSTSVDGNRQQIMVTFYNDKGAMADGQQTHQGACAVYRAQFELGTTFDLYSSMTATTPVYHCTAEDTGTAVCTNHVDVFLPLDSNTLLTMGAPTMYLQPTGVDHTVVQEAAANHPASMGCETGHNPS